MVLLVPAALITCALLGVRNSGVLTASIAGVAVLPFFLSFERSKPRARDLMPVVVLTAIASAGRLLFAPFPGVKPVAAIVIVGGLSFGRQAGFLIGALTALVSNLFFGQGPWTPWQMYCWGLMGYVAGALAQTSFMKGRAGVCAYGFAACLVYGLVMDSWYVVSYVWPLSWKPALAAYAAGLPMTLTQAVATVLFLLVILAPWSRKFQHFKRKYGICQLD
ncbi:MAG: ECF transporter S component [Coriobacteriales bacterium]|nr:ECF transporter S component [Coriobacteriales bacterium]